MGTKPPNRIAVVNLPTARVVLDGAPIPTWRNLGIRRRAGEIAGRLARPLVPMSRTVALYVVGLFPLFAAAGMALLLAWLITYHSGP